MDPDGDETIRSRVAPPASGLIHHLVHGRRETHLAALDGPFFLLRWTGLLWIFSASRREEDIDQAPTPG